MKFADFIGNERIRDTVSSAVRSGRLANAYLFAGPTSVGKRTLAMTAAAALLCERFEEETCGKCDSCRRIESLLEGGGFHPDLGIIEPDGKFIKVDQVRRDLVAATQFRPHRGSRQAFVIDPAESMHPSAANAFLKTLEEAPGGAVFFLISASPASLLPTVLSRCQRFNFQPVARDQLTDELIRRGLFNADDALTVAGLSRGAVGVALAFDLDRHKEERSLALRFIHMALGEKSTAEIFNLAAKLGKESERFGERLELISALIRDLMLVASAGSGAEIINEDIKDELLETARGRPARKLARLLSLVAEMREPMVRNVRIDSICERVMLSCREMFASPAAK
ncbi:MAG TPA: DNA polymerase III subunit delta' [Acidobacteriota bacterium]|nr:DNA polymerase III subunit delta' [Acidobacteriota bacterium]